MYNVFKDMRRDEFINSIGDYPKLSINIDNLKDLDGNEPSNFFEVSRIILEPGEKNAKYLYLRHFEANTERSKAYARVTLSDSETSLKVEILHNAFTAPYLIEKKTLTHIPLGNGKENIQYDRYGIIFDSKKQGKGLLQIFCKFIKV